MKTIAILIVLILVVFKTADAQTDLQTKTIAANLDTPWEILWGPDNFIWVTERSGKISRVNPGTGEVFEIIQITDAREVGEGGLLGMVTDPDFSANSYFYVAYNFYAAGNIYREKIVRFTFNTATGKADNPLVLLNTISGANNHNGCRLVISPDKKLIFTTGDSQNTSNSQNINSLNGKTLRINLDGSVPEDNPLPGSPVWSWGHRNPQGLAYSPDGTILYSSEHGPNNDDEINIIQKGRNYGWPTVQGFCNTSNEITFCNDSNVVEPIFAWTPTLAVAGLDFYNSDLIPEWKNSLLVTSLKASRITQLILNKSGTEVLQTKDFFTGTFGRLRDICISPDGKVFVAVSNRDGRGNPKADDDKIIEISPLTSSINETGNDRFFSVTPNPAGNFVNISFSKTPQTEIVYSLYNINGQVLKSGVIETGSTTLDLPVNFEGLAFLKLISDNQIYVKKILIKK
ncbi:MAG TPA: PQQ-dependent sugar dehydrogenase [Draconibacterium sp.]|nr:PQQ-dependent sugar dehydrogenase [Draconibacterium sp.]